MVKKFIANTLVMWFKSIRILGRQRFWLLYWAYRITGWHIRHKEWDFVLGYLPKRHSDKQYVRVLDVGCSKNLFLHEVASLGYKFIGVDLVLSDYQKNKRPLYLERDITSWNADSSFDFVTCISVLEHVGNDGKGDKLEQTAALQNMIKSLKVGGRLLLTIPTKEFAIGHEWHGFSCSDLTLMLPENSHVIEYTERAGQICCAIERILEEENE